MGRAEAFPTGATNKGNVIISKTFVQVNHGRVIQVHYGDEFRRSAASAPAILPVTAPRITEVAPV